MPTQKQYEEYLNELGKSFSKDEFIIGGKKRRGLYGTMLRKHDPTAFRCGYREWAPLTVK